MTTSENPAVTGSAASRLPIKEKIGYGVGDTASNLYFQTVMLYILFFYTDVFGLSAAAAGTMFLITRIWDAVNDPIMGMIADRTETKWGKFRPYIVSMAPLLAISGVIAFITPGFEAGGKLIYAYVTYTILWMLYTAVNVPYSALMGVITPSSLERTEVSQYRFVSMSIGQLIVSAGTLYLVKFFGRGNEQAGWSWTMGAFGLLAVILFATTFFSTKERVHAPKAGKADTKQDLKDLFKNKPWILIAIATVFQLIFAVMRGNSIPNFIKYYVHDQQLQLFTYTINLSIDGFISSVNAAGSIFMIVGAILAKVFAKTLDKKNVYSGFLIAGAVISCGFYFLQPHNVLLIFGLNVLVSFFMGAVSVLQWAIYTDTVDYGEWKFGRRATGLVMAASLFALKLGLAFGGAFVGWIAEYYGFVANVEQTESALFGIRMLMSFYPAVFGIIGGLVMISYPLKNKVMLQIEKDLEARRQ